MGGFALALLLSYPAAAQLRTAVPRLPAAPAVPVVPRAPVLSAPSLAPALPRPALPALSAPALPAAPNPVVPEVGPAAPAAPATKAELDHAAGAAFALGLAADDLGAENGLRVSRMSGADFIAVVTEARSRLDAAGGGPSPRAEAAARDVRASVLRVVRALVKPELPMSAQAPRLMSVWQVMGEELARAAEGGTLDAVTADAALFASQVEASVP